jgi:hypothetical protein
MTMQNADRFRQFTGSVRNDQNVGGTSYFPCRVLGERFVKQNLTHPG